MHRLQQQFRQSLKTPSRPRKNWGGRRRALLSWEEEEAFLAPWAEQARQAGVLVVSPLRAALAETLAALLTPEAVPGRPVRLMFQDEARFGRMVRPKTLLGAPRCDP